MTPNKKELDFNRKIDCCFPYNDEKKAKDLISESISLSPWCVGIVLHELVSIPRSVKVKKETLYNLLDYTYKIFSHDLKDEIFRISKIMIGGKYISFDEAITFLENMKNFPEVSSFISIVYFSFIDDNISEDKAIELETNFENKMEELQKYWENSVK